MGARGYGGSRPIAFRQRGVRLQVAGVARLAATADGRAILEVAGQPVFELNRVAASIWAKLAAGLSIQDINGQIVAEFGAPEERVACDVEKFIEVLKVRLLIYNDK